jgi:pimeloyl-ACP methyl ester carboxylesterase
MNCKAISVVLFSAFLSVGARAQAPAGHQTPPPAKYGSNPAAGGTFIHDGIKLYYEIYGTGEPLLLVHGNGGSINSFKAQIDYFRRRYRVIAMDSRDQGRSGDSPDAITYEKMTGDLAALLDHLKTGPVYVLGWSDGGIEALELGMEYPAKVKMIAAMAANLEPEGAVPEVIALVQSMLTATPAAVKETPEGRRELKVTHMLLDEPHIQPAALEKITAPTLILASDHDLIRDEHTFTIYHHIPNAELAIFPNATHLVPYDDPALFNATVERFFTTPYVPKDRIRDAFKSLDLMKNSQK